MSFAILGGADDLQATFQHDKKAAPGTPLIGDHLAWSEASTSTERGEPGDLRGAQLGKHRIGDIYSFRHNSTILSRQGLPCSIFILAFA
jgi:hypothetical protein